MKIKSITILFDDGKKREFKVDQDTWVFAASSVVNNYRQLGYTGSIEEQVVMLKILDQLITKKLMDNEGLNI